LSRSNSRGDAPPSFESAAAPGAEGAVFAEPWEAQVFALAVMLSSQGLYSWREWTETLGDELQRTPVDGEANHGAGYYLRWLAALERIAIARGILDENVLAGRKREWIEAYASTPHGRPVELRP
jgi:nitrile hydratase accessory protein